MTGYLNFHATNVVYTAQTVHCMYTNGCCQHENPHINLHCIHTVHDSSLKNTAWLYCYSRQPWQYNINHYSSSTKCKGLGHIHVPQVATVSARDWGTYSVHVQQVATVSARDWGAYTVQEVAIVVEQQTLTHHFRSHHLKKLIKVNGSCAKKKLR